MPKPLSHRHWREELGPLALVALLPLMMSLPLLLHGVPVGDSVQFNLSWLRAFSEQLMAGDLYPRWLPQLNAGAGSPVFYFYAPLPFHVSALLGWLFCPACAASIKLAMGAAALLMASGVSFYALARRHVSPAFAAVGAILYAALPYHLEIDLWRRQAIGEFAAYAFIPWVFFYAERVSEHWRGLIGLSIAYALLALSHLPATLIVSAFAAFYASVIGSQSASWKPLLRVGAGLTLGLGLAAIHLAPALLTQSFIHSEQWSVYRYDEHWITTLTPGDGFRRRLLLVLAASTLTVLPLIIALWRCPTADRRASVLPWIGMLALAWFLMLPVSQPVWRLVPVLQKVQFPWRAGTMLDFCVAMIAALAIERIRRSRGRILTPAVIGAASVTALLLASSAWKLTRYHVWALSQDTLVADVADGYDAAEYRPVWVENHEVQRVALPASMKNDIQWRVSAALLQREPMLSYPPEVGLVQLVKSGPRRVDLAVDTTQDAQVVVRRFYYPAWHVTTDAAGVGVRVQPARSSGLIELSAPAGHYQLSLQLSPLPQERLGEVVSAGSMALLALLWAVGFARRHRFK